MSRCVELLLAATLVAGQVLPTRLEVPDPLPSPEAFRFEQLAPRQVPLAAVTQDLAGIATRSEQPRRLELRLDANLLFAKDSATILPQARRRLDELRAELVRREAGSVTITGHTDDLGSAEHGLQLSRRRAEAVEEALGQGLTAQRVVVQGLGESHPVVPNDSEANRARNRRVEVVFTAGRR